MNKVSNTVCISQWPLHVVTRSVAVTHLAHASNLTPALIRSLFVSNMAHGHTDGRLNASY